MKLQALVVVTQASLVMVLTVWNFQLYGQNGLQGFLQSNWGGWAAYADTSGNWTATGNVTAYSDEKLKDNVAIIESPLEKIEAIRGNF